MSLGKKVLFGFWIVIGFVLCLEVFFHLLGVPSFSEKEARAVLASEQTDPYGIERTKGGENVLHPYLGYVVRSGVNPFEGTKAIYGEGLGIPANDWGFCSESTPIQKRTPDKYIIGVMGGSVAANFAVLGADTIRKTLALDPKFQGKKIVIVNMAVGGYKQPQQLIALNYFLSMGCEFDLILNLDGFNEIAIAPVEFQKAKIWPWFPERWYPLVSQWPAPRQRLMLGEVAYMTQERKRLAEAFLKRGGLSRLSSFPALFWRREDTHWAESIADLRTRLNEFKDTTRIKDEWVSLGPSYGYEIQGSLWRDLSFVWTRSSKMMDVMCRAHRTRYIHCLQPNQYVLGSRKAFTTDERSVAFSDNDWRKAVEIGYPKLQTRGKALRVSGVEFYDLTPIYRDVSSAIYVDPVCHIGKKGNELMGQVIAELIRFEPGKDEEEEVPDED